MRNMLAMRELAQKSPRIDYTVKSSMKEILRESISVLTKIGFPKEVSTATGCTLCQSSMTSYLPVLRLRDFLEQLNTVTKSFISSKNKQPKPMSISTSNRNGTVLKNLEFPRQILIAMLSTQLKKPNSFRQLFREQVQNLARI